MKILRHSILAASIAVSLGGAGIAHAASADRRDEPPDARYCTNDPKLATDLYEYLADCPAAAGMLNENGAWVGVERNSLENKGAAGEGMNGAMRGSSGMAAPGDVTSHTGGTMGAGAPNPGTTGGLPAGGAPGHTP